MAKYIDQIFHPTLAPIIKWLLNVGALLVILWGFFWNFSGPIVESYADEIFEQKLIKLGVSPKAISEMKAQGEQNGTDIKSLAQDADLIRGDINAVKQQAQSISNKQDSLSAQTTRIEGQVDQILDALLSRPAQ